MKRFGPITIALTGLSGLALVFSAACSPAAQSTPTAGVSTPAAPISSPTASTSGVVQMPSGPAVLSADAGARAVSVIDATSNRQVGSIQLTGIPQYIAVTPDGSQAWVLTSTATGATGTSATPGASGSTPAASTPSGSSSAATPGLSGTPAAGTLGTSTPSAASTGLATPGASGAAGTPRAGSTAAAGTPSTGTGTTSATPAAGSSGAAATPGASGTVTPARADHIEIIDLSNGKVMATVSGLQDGRTIKFNSTGTTAYVSDRQANDVVAYDVKSHTRASTIPVSGAPRDLAVADVTGGTRLFVILGANDSLAVVDPAARAVVNTVKVGQDPIAVAYEQANQLVVVANQNSRDLTVVPASVGTTSTGTSTGSSGTAAATPRTGSNPVATSGTGSGSLATPGTGSSAAATPGTGSSLAGTPGTGTTSGSATVATIGLPGTPTNLAVSPVGNTVLVTISTPRPLLVSVDLAAQKVAQQLTGLGGEPTDIVFSSDGSRAYVSSWDASVVAVVDVSQMKEIATVPVGKAPVAVAYRTSPTGGTGGAVSTPAAGTRVPGTATVSTPVGTASPGTSSVGTVSPGTSGAGTPLASPTLSGGSSGSGGASTPSTSPTTTGGGTSGTSSPLGTPTTMP